MEDRDLAFVERKSGGYLGSTYQGWYDEKLGYAVGIHKETGTGRETVSGSLPVPHLTEDPKTTILRGDQISAVEMHCPSADALRSVLASAERVSGSRVAVPLMRVVYGTKGAVLMIMLGKVHLGVLAEPFLPQWEPPTTLVLTFYVSPSGTQGGLAEAHHNKVGVTHGLRQYFSASGGPTAREWFDRGNCVYESTGPPFLDEPSYPMELLGAPISFPDPNWATIAADRPVDADEIMKFVRTIPRADF